MPRGPRPLEQERPELRLGQDDQPRPGGRERLLDRAREVERKGEDRDSLAGEGARGLQARRRRHRETEAGAGRSPGERRQKVPGDTDLSHRHRVDPDAAVQIGVGREPQPASDVSQPSPSRDRPDERIRGVDEERQNRQDSVKEHAGAIIADAIDARSKTYNSMAYVSQKASNGRRAASV